MNFESNLALLRKRKGLSQEDLASLVGVSRQTIYSWEAGLNSPSIVMLKKLSDVLGVSSGDLLEGYQVNRLPKKLEHISLTKIGDHEETVIYKELPNWFISLRENEEVSWGLYVNEKRDEAHHLKVIGKAKIHDESGLEILDEAYDGELNPIEGRTFYCQEKDEGIGWFAISLYLDGVKTLLTYKDERFLDDWGINGQHQYQGFTYDDAEDYLLQYGEKKLNVIRISYFASNAKDDSKRLFIEVYLDKNGESLLWRRYSKWVTKSKDVKVIDGVQYGFEYECVTSRLLRLVL